jgi:hypothetical protein
MEQCSNCGRVIGNLETPNIWQQHVVCAECHERLAATSAAAQAPLVSQKIANSARRNKSALRPIRRVLQLISLAGAATFTYGIIEAHAPSGSLDLDYANNLQGGGLAIFAVAGLAAGAFWMIDRRSL